MAPSRECLIAIVDEDPAVRDALESVRMSAALTTESFASAEAFLGSTARERAAFLILDVELSDMSGLELQQHLTGRIHENAGTVVMAHADAADAYALLVAMTSIPANNLSGRARA
jgi:FixJ family two-component response regulator